MQLYATRLEGEIPVQDWQKLCGLIPEYRQVNISKLLVRQDRERSLLAGLLLRHAAIYALGVEPLLFEFNCYGKPALAGRSDFHFNLSHAGSWIVCAVDRQSIGIDVEKTDEVDFASLAKIAFSPEERRTLQSKRGEDQLDYFYAVWTLKESYCKATGQGMSMEPEKLTVKADEHGQWSISPEVKPIWHFRRYTLETSYRIAVCARREAFPENASLVPWRSLG